MRKILLLMALVASMSWAGFFIESNETKTEAPREIPTFFYGGSVDAGYYLRSVDVGINLAGEFRIAKHHSLALSATGLFVGGVYQAGLDYRFFFGGSMMEFSMDDFVRLSVSGVFVENFKEMDVSPMISVGYGRDFVPMAKANFLVRLEISLGYMFGDGIVDDDEDKLINYETNLLAHFNIGVMFF
ncbi:MAG: hypothetical protein MJY85_08350 [Fibrobacter sp.]|nr:hypothetical protein [Fibrobacter sp.]